jgi:hypothetical protein
MSRMNSIILPVIVLLTATIFGTTTTIIIYCRLQYKLTIHVPAIFQPQHKLPIALVLSWRYFEAEMDVMEETVRLGQLVLREIKEREEIPGDHRDQED